MNNDERNGDSAMNMINTDTTEYAKATKHTTWQEVVPFLRTDDIVAVRFREGETEHIAKVWVSRDTRRVMAGVRFLQYADGRFNARVADVVLRSVCVQANDLEPLAASLKAGDVVRATFAYMESPFITLEGMVETDRNGDVFLTMEGEDGDLPGAWYLTLRGLVSPNLRALEIIDPDEDADMGLPPEPEPLPVHQVRLQPGNGYAWQKLPHGWECAQLAEYLTDDDVRSWPVMEIIAGDDKDIEEIIEDITGEEHAMDMSTPEGRLAAFKTTPSGTKVSATYVLRHYDGVFGAFNGDFAIVDEYGCVILWLTDCHTPDMDIQDITFHEDEPEADAAKTPSWVDVLPFLVPGDVVTIHVSGIPPTRDATVTVDPDGTIVAGPRFLRYRGGAPGDYIENVILEELADPNSDTLRTTLRSLKAGDTVRATFLGIGDAPAAIATVDGSVCVDEDGDTCLTEGDSDTLVCLSTLGRAVRHLRAIEVLSRADDTPEPKDAEPLTFAAYAARAAETAVYPGAGTFWGLQYVTAGIASEAGEVLGKITKMQRDGGYTPESSTFWGGDRADIVAELGDVAWYLAMVCREADIDPNEVLRRNLADRAARDTIQGAGDNR